MGILRGTAELVRVCGRMAISRVSSVVQRSSEKLGNSGFLVRSRDPIPIATKLMIVAHPDDESLFGGEALTSSRGWLVVCVTNASNPTRRAEFVKAMSLAGADYLVLDHPDNIANGNFHPSLASTLEGPANRTRLRKGGHAWPERGIRPSAACGAPSNRLRPGTVRAFVYFCHPMERASPHERSKARTAGMLCLAGFRSAIPVHGGT
jgi:hypothetical protein